MSSRALLPLRVAAGLHTLTVSSCAIGSPRAFRRGDCILGDSGNEGMTEHAQAGHM